ncbi:MAG: GNAT family N-acetyltransferase [Gammaproteobacteria bacterium]|nr:GNAT family N-acetyltransferase [Gammaproteobacteria bacterium]
MVATTNPATQKLIISHIRTNECVRGFSCGVREIDRWAREKAFKRHEKGRSRVFIARDNDAPPTLGFYALSFSLENSSKLHRADDRDAWPSGAPLIYIDYLAVQKVRQEAGLGTLLLMNALERAHRVSKDVAFYGVALRSLNERTTKLYKKYGFGMAPKEGANPLMILPIWSINDLFGAA